MLCAGLPALALDTRQDAPRINARTIDGERITNESLKGKPVLIQFWTTWCRYCQADQSAVEAVLGDFRDKGLEVIAVNVGESRKKVKQYLERSRRTCKVVLTEDTNLAAVYRATSYPLYVLIDREGKVAGQQDGAGGEALLRTLLKKVGLGEE
jgi:thiol-disulfide isomerase/thioredoxin